MSERPCRCAIYIRVSTAEQQMHGKSLEAQADYLVRYAKDHNMIVMGVFADEGKTARKELKKRKAIHALLGAVKRQELDVILFWRIDRWFRNMSDFYKVQDILDEYNVSWISASEPGMNMHTRDGRLQLNVILSIGQNEVDTTSERICFVNEASVRQGKLIFGKSNMPLGYTTGTDGKGKCMVKDPETEHMVTDFFRYFRQHQVKSAAIRYMQETYHINFSYSMLRTMLSSEFYKGTYRGFPYCPAYLTEQEWREIQDISKRNIKRPRSNRIYLFTGLIHCPICGQQLVGTGCSSIINRNTGEKRTYCYYRCNRAALDKLCAYTHKVSQKLIEDTLMPRLHEEYKNFSFHVEKITAEKEKKRKVRTSDSICSELARLNMLYQKERISLHYYTEEYDRLELEMKELRNISAEPQPNFTSLRKLLTSDFNTLYTGLTLENRRSFWRSIIKEIYLNEDATIKCVDFL